MNVPAASSRRLIVNADDFGFSSGVNRGIVEAHEHGIVTSTSLMVEQPAAGDAAEYARAHPGLGVGLHLELPRPLVRRDVTTLVHARARRQLERFRALVGRDPTHIDSHRHAHRREPARSAALELGAELGVPVRHFSPAIRHSPEFYGQRYGRIYSTTSVPERVGVDALVGILERLEPGATELCCHPGYPEDLPLPFRKEPYRTERTVEVRTLCDPVVRRTVEQLGIQLCAFSDVDSS